MHGQSDYKRTGEAAAAAAAAPAAAAAAAAVVAIAKRSSLQVYNTMYFHNEYWLLPRTIRYESCFLVLLYPIKATVFQVGFSSQRRSIIQPSLRFPRYHHPRHMGYHTCWSRLSSLVCYISFPISSISQAGSTPMPHSRIDHASQPDPLIDALTCPLVT